MKRSPNCAPSGRLIAFYFAVRATRRQPHKYWTNTFYKMSPQPRHLHCSVVAVWRSEPPPHRAAARLSASQRALFTQGAFHRVRALGQIFLASGPLWFPVPVTAQAPRAASCSTYPRLSSTVPNIGRFAPACQLAEQPNPFRYSLSRRHCRGSDFATLGVFIMASYPIEVRPPQSSIPDNKLVPDEELRLHPEKYFQVSSYFLARLICHRGTDRYI